MAQVFAKRNPRSQSSQAPHIYNLSVQNSLRDRPIGYVVNSHQMDGWYPFREDVENYVPLIESLEHAFSNSVFCCGGYVCTPNEDLKDFILKVKPKADSEDEDNWKEFSLNNILPEDLMKYCNPSSFGDLKEMKTVLDPEVRLAYEIKTDRFDFGYVNWSDEFDRFVRSDQLPGHNLINYHIGDELVPGRRIDLKRNKLNIYGKGGFFKSHVDTPFHDNMIGTLVVCLPSPHKGGELIVSHDGLEHVFDFSKFSNDPTKFQWAAFYGNCAHKVRPVVEGFRVTITYGITVSNIRRLKEGYYDRHQIPVEEHFEMSPKCELHSFAKVDRALTNLPEKLGSKVPEYIGFILKHKYTIPGLQPIMLKGEDKGLLDYLTDKGWKCQLKTILSRFMTRAVYTNTDDDYIYDGEMDYQEKHEIYEFKPHEVISPDDECSDRFSKQRNQWGSVRSGTPFIEIYRKPDNDKLVRNNEGNSCWVGNEVHNIDVDKIYLDSALIVKLQN